MSLAQCCWTAILLSFFAALGSRSSDRQVELRPVDEAVRQADLFTFRAHLQAAVAAHDVASVLAVVHPNIKNHGRTGYVAAQFIRSPIGYRAVFTRTGDRWQLTAFIAGD